MLSHQVHLHCLIVLVIAPTLLELIKPFGAQRISQVSYWHLILTSLKMNAIFIQVNYRNVAIKVTEKHQYLN